MRRLQLHCLLGVLLRKWLWFSNATSGTQQWNMSVPILCLSANNPGHAALQYELLYAQDSSARFEARRRPVYAQERVTERHIAQATPQLTVAGAKLAFEKFRLRALEAQLLNVQNEIVDQGWLVTDIPWFPGTSLKKKVLDLFMLVFDHFWVYGSVFLASMSELCNIVMTTAFKRHKESQVIIAEGLDCALVQPEFGENNNSHRSQFL